MNATTLAPPIRVNTAGIHARPRLGRLAAVELRKMVDTRAGFWLQVATLAITVAAVAVRSVVGDAADHTFASVLEVGLKPAAVLLPVAGILLVTSEWSQRTGMITFALVPVRSRVLAAKLIASLVLAMATLAVGVAVVAAAWSGVAPLIGQSAVYLGGGIVIGVAFGAILLAPAPALVALFALPSAWLAVTSLPFFGDLGPWLDTGRGLGPLSREVIDGTQWAQAGTSLALWMLLPLLAGAWRITRREVAS
jgi:hypothetical protein